MKKYIVRGGKKLSGTVAVSGAKNVALKALVAACLTSGTVEIKNIPLIGDFHVMVDLIREIGGRVEILDHKARIKVEKIKKIKIPLDMGAKVRTSSLFFSPLLARSGHALIPNPGGCRIGNRPIDWHIKGLERLGAKISYRSADGYFHAESNGLKGGVFRFPKNTHTGTEALILAGVGASGRTIIENAASEPEVDDLINLLSLMGAKIKRRERRVITIDGVKKLHGATFEIMPDRNEIVTFTVASILTGGEIFVKNTDVFSLSSFLKKLNEAEVSSKRREDGVRFYAHNKIKPVDIVTSPHPGFMTDWQGPWAVLMSQADGVSTIHETVYENRFGYIAELEKMGGEFQFFNPKVGKPQEFYNFNYTEQKNDGNFHTVKVFGPRTLHNAILEISDLRAGATLVLAALIARGESTIYGVEHIERGYEDFDGRLRKLGADIRVVEEEV